MQDYVMFTDLTDPNYGKELIPWEEELSQEVQTLETRLEEERYVYETFSDDSTPRHRYNQYDQVSSRSGSPFSEFDFSP